MNKSLVHTICMFPLASVAFAAPGMSQEKQAGDSAHKIVHSGDLKCLQIHGMGPFKVNWVNPSEVQPPDAPAAATSKRQ